MKAADFDKSIRAAVDFYADNELVEFVVRNSALSRSEEFNRTSLTTKNYKVIYELGLSLSHYNFLLRDLAFFQFSFRNETEWALAYYPNPRLSGSPDAMDKYRSLIKRRDEGEISEENLSQLLVEMPDLGCVPRIRFEYSGKQYIQVKHPGAHFHIGMSGEDRWCSARALSPKTFAFIIAKYYYPEMWWSKSRFSLPKNEQELEENILTCVDQHLVDSMHNDGVSLFLTEYEKMSLHFSALLGAGGSVKVPARK